MHLKLFVSLTFFSIGVFTFAYFIYILPFVFFARLPLLNDKIGIEKANANSHSNIPLASNQWFSSIYKSFPTAPLYALPLVYKLSENGVEISYPTITKNANEIIAPFNTDLSVNTNSKTHKVVVKSIGDWHITTSLTDSKNNEMTAQMGHGLPFLSIASNSNLQLVMNKRKKFTIFINDQEVKSTQGVTQASDTIILESPDASYIVLLSKSSPITYDGERLMFDRANEMVIGLLDSEKNISSFKDLRNISVLDTQTYPTIQNEELSVQYNVQTVGAQKPLIALYPHHYDYLHDSIQKLGEYRSIRGPMYLYKTATFTTTSELVVPSTSYQSVINQSEPLKLQIKKDVEEIIKKGPPSDRVYTLGTWFGKVSTLIILADSHNLQKEKQDLIRYIKPVFEKSLVHFTYDKNKTSVIATKPEYGNEDLNDHHFHYAYYIRLASVISSFDLAYADVVKNPIEEMVKDIATINRQETKFPFLRNYDIYESHSWADGYSNSEFGNNQESSSEAIHTWYSLYLWSQITHNANLRQYALYLYNSEIIGAKYYWFDVKDLYTEPYEHAIASQVWGGKINFSTWFSGETNMKYGIQLLPLTPGSKYLSGFEDFEKYANDFEKSEGSLSEEWGDLFLVWKSFYEPETALSEEEEITKQEGNNSKSNLLYHLYKNSE